MQIELKGFVVRHIINAKGDTCEGYEVLGPKGKLLLTTYDRERAFDFIEDVADEETKNKGIGK